MGDSPTATVVLRFANREAVDTIDEHRRLLTGQGSVWWGWFKKADEVFPFQELQAFQGHLPAYVALVNREEGAFFLATCRSLVMTRDVDAAIPSPSRERTPQYYDEAYLPAWFEFTDIVQQSREEWVARVGGIPEGNPTIAIAPGDPGDLGGLPRVLPARGAPAPAIGRSILHISDIHYGELHGFPDAPGIGEKPLQTVLSEFLGSGSHSIAGIVASGDFTSKGDANHFPRAEELLTTLLGVCGLTLEHLVVVPGNHDIWLQDVDNFDRDFRHENPYRSFLRSLYGRDLTEIEDLKAVDTVDGWTITFLALNSARARSVMHKEYGYVGPDRYGPWIDRLREVAAGSHRDLIAGRRLNVAVLHHHLLPAGLVSRPPTPRPVSLTLDAGAIVADFQRGGVHLALHGHEHLPFVGRTTRARRGRPWELPEDALTVIGSGSTGAGVAHMSDEHRHNTFSVYTPIDDALRVEVFQFNPAVAPECVVDIQLAL